MNQREFTEIIENIKEYSRISGKEPAREEIEREFREMGLAPEQVDLVCEYFRQQETKEEKDGFACSQEKAEEMRREDERFYREYRRSLEEQWPGMSCAKAMTGEAQREWERKFNETAESEERLALFLTAVPAWVKPYAGRGVAAADLVQEANLCGLELLGDEAEVERLKACGKGLLYGLQEKIRERLQAYAAQQRRDAAEELEMLEKVNQVQACARTLSQELGRKAEVGEVAGRLCREEKEIREILAYAGNKVENIIYRD